MKNNGMLNSKTGIAIAVGLIMTGCSSTHTEKWNEVNDNNSKRELKLDNAQQQIVPKDRPTSKIVDGFYVDTNPMEIIQEEKTSLPSIFHKKFSLYGNDPLELTEIAGDIYKRTGLSIDFINNEKPDPDANNTLDTAIEDSNNNVATNYFNPNEDATLEEIIYEDEKEKETDETIYVNHNGTLKQLLDFIAVKKGLKWKYEQSTNKIFVYKYDTRTYTILGFGESIEKESSITTTMESDSGSGENGDSSTSNEQSIKINNKTEYWESVKETIQTMVSPRGQVSFNDSQGKIILTDNDFVLSAVDDVVENLNDDAFREVTLKIEVVNLTINDERNISASLDIQGLNDKFNFSLGDAFDFANAPENSLSFSDGTTSAMLQLLDKVGQATVENKVTAVTLNNMPIPVQITKNRTYIEQISTEDDGDTGNTTTEVDVGIVSEGITMTATPKAVGQNIMLDYSLNLSSIDSIDDAPGDVKVQLPITSTKNFVQRSNLKNGVPRIIATVERATEENSSSHPLNENLWFAGGSEGVNVKKDILMVVVTPYISDLK